MAIRITHASLFSGIGGFNLAAEWAVALQIFETINECENHANRFG